MAAEERTLGAALSSLVTPTLRQLLTWIGVGGVGGGGFAALCFGVGFLATRNHDEMLGLPSQASASSALVRVGAMFFPNSLYDVLVGTWKATAVLFVLALTAWGVAESLRRRVRSLGVPVSRTAVAAWFLAAHVVLLAFGLVLFEDRAATLHPSNRHLLLSRPTIPAQVAPPGPALVSPLRYFAAERLDAKAGRVRDELRADPEIARNHYGRSVALVGVFVALLALERRFWTDRTIRVLDWLVRPILYLVAIVLLLTLPAAYGVLSGDDLRMRLRRGRGRGEIPRPAAPDRSLTPGPLPRVPRAPRPVSG